MPRISKNILNYNKQKRTKKQYGGSHIYEDELEFQAKIFLREKDGNFNIFSSELNNFINPQPKCAYKNICIDTQKYLLDHKNGYQNEGNINYQILLAITYIYALSDYNKYQQIFTKTYNNIYLIDYQNLCFFHTRYNTKNIGTYATYTESYYHRIIASSILTLANQNMNNIYLYVNPREKKPVQFLGNNNNLIVIGMPSEKTISKQNLINAINACKFVNNKIDTTNDFAKYLVIYLNYMSITNKCEKLPKPDIIQQITNYFSNKTNIYFYSIKYRYNITDKSNKQTKTKTLIPIFKNYIPYDSKNVHVIKHVTDDKYNFTVSYIDDTSLSTGFGGNTTDDILLFFIGEHLYNYALKNNSSVKPIIISNDNFREFTGTFMSIIKQNSTKVIDFVLNELQPINFTDIGTLIQHSQQFKYDVDNPHNPAKRPHRGPTTQPRYTARGTTTQPRYTARGTTTQTKPHTAKRPHKGGYKNNKTKKIIHSISR